jgi:hypothetical protein
LHIGRSLPSPLSRIVVKRTTFLTRPHSYDFSNPYVRMDENPSVGENVFHTQSIPVSWCWSYAASLLFHLSKYSLLSTVEILYFLLCTNLLFRIRTVGSRCNFRTCSSVCSTPTCISINYCTSFCAEDIIAGFSGWRSRPFWFLDSSSYTTSDVKMDIAGTGRVGFSFWYKKASNAKKESYCSTEP